MTDQHECKLDPEPYLRSGMAASCQTTWWGPQKFKPREGYCQNEDHYSTAGVGA